MKKLYHRASVAGVVTLGLGLAACGSSTANTAASGDLAGSTAWSPGTCPPRCHRCRWQGALVGAVWTTVPRFRVAWW